MDVTETLKLIFSLALIAAVAYIPYVFLHKVVRGMIRTCKKTFHVFSE